MIAFYENGKRYVTSMLNREMNFNSHLHNQVEIIYIVEGTLNVTIDFKSENLKAGEGAIVFPNTVHSYKSEQSNMFRLAIIDLDVLLDYSNTLLKYAPKSPFLKTDEIHEDAIHALTILEKDVIEDTRLSKSYANIAVGRFIEKLELEKSEDLPRFDLTMKILNYICDNYRENITLDLLAKKIGASKYHISRIFSKRIGCSFNYYINSLRVGLSQHLLSDNQLSITDIAFECGFESQRSFNRAFKEFLEMTPSEYRATL